MTASDRMYGYLNTDATVITDAEGKVVGTVTAKHKIKLPRRSWIHGKDMLAVTVRDGDGRLWYGRGSPMIAITLRPITKATLRNPLDLSAQARKLMR